MGLPAGPGYRSKKRHWNSLHLDGSISWNELGDMIDHSYDIVTAGPPWSVRRRPP
jgi:predicted DNA-binding protein (MmcQ/YjbR family)